MASNMHGLSLWHQLSAGGSPGGSLQADSPCHILKCDKTGDAFTRWSRTKPRPSPTTRPISRGPGPGACVPPRLIDSSPPKHPRWTCLPGRKAAPSQRNPAAGGRSRPGAGAGCRFVRPGDWRGRRRGNLLIEPDEGIGRIPLFDTLRGRHLLLPFEAANGITQVIFRDPPQPCFKGAGLLESKGGYLQKRFQVCNLHHIPGFDHGLPGSPDL